MATEYARDVYKRKASFQGILNKLENQPGYIQIVKNQPIILKYLKDAEIGKAGKKRIGLFRLYRSYSCLKLFSDHIFKKPFLEVTEADVEKFVRDLADDRLLNIRNERPYSPESKRTYKAFLKKFYKYLGKLELVSWIDVSEQRVEISAITREEMDKLIQRAANPQFKALLAVVCDGGFRIQEILNVKKSDVKRYETLEGRDYYFMLNIKYSKTKPRTVDLTLAKEYLQAYLEEATLDENDFLFEPNYSSVRLKLMRHSKKVLWQSITWHQLRHSSATYWSQRMDQSRFAYRFGWRYNSDSINRYIDNNGLEMHKSAQDSINSGYSDLKRKYADLEAEMNSMRLMMEKISKITINDEALNVLVEATKKEKVSI